MNLEAQTSKVLLQFGEHMEVRWCQIKTTGRMGKNLPVPSAQEVRCGASDVWPGIMVQEQHSKLKKHIRGLRFQIDEGAKGEVK
jgi:hypothetical protein